MNERISVAIVGPGAMGGLFGALLAESGVEVRLVGRRPEQAAAINDHGLRIERAGVVRSVQAPAFIDPGEAGPADLVLIFVKSGQTRAAAESAGRIVAPGGAVLTLQNGLGNAEIIAEVVGQATILAGTTAQGTTVLGPGQVRHAGVGPTVLGPWQSDDMASADRVRDLFERAGIPTETVRDVATVLWNKLIVNVGINAVTALTGVRNGQLLDLASTRDLCRAAVEEAVAVARAVGIAVREDALEHVFQVAEATAGNRSSMGQDVDRRKPTEIGAINGVIVREGSKFSIPTPVNQTLTALVETLEAHYP